MASVSHTPHIFILHSSDLIEQHFSVLMEAETSFGDVPWARRNLLEKGQAPETMPWCDPGQGLKRMDSQLCKVTLAQTQMWAEQFLGFGNFW